MTFARSDTLVETLTSLKYIIIISQLMTTVIKL